MQVIKDVNERLWEFDLNIGTAEPLEKYLKEQEIDLFNASVMIAVLSSPIQSLNIIAFLLRKEIADAGMTSADFGRAFKGAQAYKAQRALIQEYRDFFPDPAIQDAIDQTLDRTLQLSEQEQLLIRRSIEKALDNYEKRVETISGLIGNGSPRGPLSPVSAPNTGSSNTQSLSKSPKNGKRPRGKKRGL